MESKILKLKIPAIILFIALLGFAFYEFRATDSIIDLDSYLFKNFMIPFALLSILTTAFFHFIDERFRAVFTGEDSNWLRRLKLAGRLLIIFPGLILFYYIVTKSAISFINREIGIQQEILVKGQIMEKSEKESKRVTNHYFEIRDNAASKELSLKVPYEDYLNHNIGDSYSTTYIKGYLGYLYKER